MKADAVHFLDATMSVVIFVFARNFPPVVMTRERVQSLLLCVVIFCRFVALLGQIVVILSRFVALLGQIAVVRHFAAIKRLKIVARIVKGIIIVANARPVKELR